jgi:hypothetical protein
VTTSTERWSSSSISWALRSDAGASRRLVPILRTNMVLETALNGRAELLVTFNRRHFAKAARLFRLTIAAPAEALKRLEKKHATE